MLEYMQMHAYKVGYMAKQVQIWERLDTDTDKSYQAFCIYRDNPKYSLADVAQV